MRQRSSDAEARWAYVRQRALVRGRGRGGVRGRVAPTPVRVRARAGGARWELGLELLRVLEPL